MRNLDQVGIKECFPIYTYSISFKKDFQEDQFTISNLEPTSSTPIPTYR